MDEKIVISTYLILHLTATDFICGFIGAFIRVLGNYSKARHKITASGEYFSNAHYFNCNWDQMLYGFTAGLGLLFILPETVIHVGEQLLGFKVVWNSGFSGIVGIAGIEIVAGVINKTKYKFQTPP